MPISTQLPSHSSPTSNSTDYLLRNLLLSSLALLAPFAVETTMACSLVRSSAPFLFSRLPTLPSSLLPGALSSLSRSLPSRASCLRASLLPLRSPLLSFRPATLVPRPSHLLRPTSLGPSFSFPFPFFSIIRPRLSASPTVRLSHPSPHPHPSVLPLLAPLFLFPRPSVPLSPLPVRPLAFVPCSLRSRPRAALACLPSARTRHPTTPRLARSPSTPSSPPSLALLFLVLPSRAFRSLSSSLPRATAPAGPSTLPPTLHRHHHGHFRQSTVNSLRLSSLLLALHSASSARLFSLVVNSRARSSSPPSLAWKRAGGPTEPAVPQEEPCDGGTLMLDGNGDGRMKPDQNVPELGDRSDRLLAIVHLSQSRSNLKLNCMLTSFLLC